MFLSHRGLTMRPGMSHGNTVGEEETAGGDRRIKYKLEMKRGWVDVIL